MSTSILDAPTILDTHPDLAKITCGGDWTVRLGEDVATAAVVRFDRELLVHAEIPITERHVPGEKVELVRIREVVATALLKIELTDGDSLVVDWIVRL